MFCIGWPLLLKKNSLLLCNLSATPFTKRILIQPVASVAAPIQRVFSHSLSSAATSLVADNLYLTCPVAALLTKRVLLCQPPHNVCLCG
jgi:hypothetical protein